MANPALLDVFEGEPAPDRGAGRRARVATPHIAGHSLDGKANGTQMIYDAACAFLGVHADLEPAPVAAAGAGAAGHRPARRRRRGGARGGRRRLSIGSRRRGAARGSSPTATTVRSFRRYREQYPERRELNGRPVRFVAPLTDAIRMLNAYGARVEPWGADAAALAASGAPNR